MASGLSRALAVLAGAVAITCWAGGPAAASVILTDGNSQATFDLGSIDGLTSWNVDGAEQVRRQAFWYRVGPTGGEQSLATLALQNVTTFDMSGDGRDDTLRAWYLGPGFQVEIGFVLTGGEAGSLVSDLLESIRITNTGTESLDFHFFQYADFNLGTGLADTVEILGGNTASQSGDGLFLTETVVAPVPAHYQAGSAAALLGLLTDTLPTTLTDKAGPVSGDVAWAFEWDTMIQPGGTMLIGKDKSIVPEPATVVLMGLGAAAVLLGRR